MSHKFWNSLAASLHTEITAFTELSFREDSEDRREVEARERQLSWGEGGERLGAQFLHWRGYTGVCSSHSSVALARADSRQNAAHVQLSRL